MITLGLVCLFLSVVLLIMGAMAWGSVNMKDFDEDQAAQDEAKKEQDGQDSQ